MPEIIEMAELLTVEEIAQRLRLTQRTIYRLLKNGKLPAIKVGHQWRFAQEDIDRWLQRNNKEIPLRILIIDKDPIVSLMFEEALEPLGHFVICAETASKSIDYIKRQYFDAIFINLNMPRLNIAELLRRIQQENINTKITVMTESLDSEKVLKALEYGSITLMRKPTVQSDVTYTMNQLGFKSIKNEVSLRQST